MVYIRNLSFSGLYSYGEEQSVNGVSNNVIVGPNNSGKSNVFRIIKLVSDSFYNYRRLEDSEISPTYSKAFVKIELVLSDDETKTLVKFFSFYVDKKNNVSNKFYDFTNKEKIAKLLNEITIKLTWQKRTQSSAYDPFLEISFPKINLEFFSPYIHHGYTVSNVKTDFKEPRPMMDSNLQVLLEEISTKDEDPKQITNSFFSVQNNQFLYIDKITHDRNQQFSDKARETLKDIDEFLESGSIDTNDIAFANVFGKILASGIRFTNSTNRIPHSFIHEFIAELKYEGTNEPQKEEFNKRLKSRISEISLEYTEELRNDGGNLAIFLFSLRNSKKITQRIKFDIIKKSFEEICFAENLTFDVILEYDEKSKWRNSRHQISATPKYPKIVIINKNNHMHYSFDQVGTGVSEIIYLLTASHGSENSVILMDEPSVNLHPSMMKALMSHIKNSDCQFFIITHSPDLTHYEIFDNDANICYVRKHGGSSKVLQFDEKHSTWFSKNRSRFKHQIDSRIFFAKCIILTEGDSDRNLLGVFEFLKTIDQKLNLDSQDIIITSVGGKDNFKKYQKLLESFEIPFVILTDDDAKDFFKNHASISKDGLVGNETTVVIKDGDLEYWMEQLDPILFQSSRIEFGKSKPTVAFEFAKKMHEKDPIILKPINDFLLLAVEKSKL